MYYALYQSPLGEIAVTANDNGLTALAFQQGESPISIDESMQNNESKFSDVFKQLDDYFAGKLKVFNLALSPKGTKFQQQVWQTLATIPFGDTKSYAWLAHKINNEKAVRAVGSANGANPIALIVPCHRVIGSNGKLTGYAGGLDLKAKLLQHEGITLNDTRQQALAL